MVHIARPVVILTSAILTLVGWLGWQLVSESRPPVLMAGFWFEDVTFASPRLGGPLDAAELARVRATAEAELVRAFAGLRIQFSEARRARYHVRVVQDVRDARFRRPVHVAGQSRAMAGFGGGGVVSFDFLASSALVYAPATLGRADLVDAIGRGIGRAAVHEFTHQLLPRAPIHDSRDRASYEFRSAARPEQYVGELHWDLARPLLEARFAP